MLCAWASSCGLDAKEVDHGVSISGNIGTSLKCVVGSYLVIFHDRQGRTRFTCKRSMCDWYLPASTKEFTLAPKLQTTSLVVNIPNEHSLKLDLEETGHVRIALANDSVEYYTEVPPESLAEVIAWLEMAMRDSKDIMLKAKKLKLAEITAKVEELQLERDLLSREVNGNE